MSDDELELRPVVVNGETVYVNRFGDLWRWRYHTKFMKIENTIDKNGYIRPKINGKPVKQHRIIALAFLGLDITDTDIQVDHRNGIRHDNRLENLRLVTHQQNNFNRTMVKGYSWNKRKMKWITQIKINSRSIHLGYFESEDEARQAYLDAKVIHHQIL